MSTTATSGVAALKVAGLFVVLFLRVFSVGF